MKILVITLVCLACLSCSHVSKPFVQGDIRIVPPVTWVGNEKIGSTNAFTVNHFNDGGTEWIKIVDAEGARFDIYRDRRFKEVAGTWTNEPGTIYLNAYPASSNTVLIADQKRFKKDILKDILGELDRTEHGPVVTADEFKRMQQK